VPGEEFTGGFAPEVPQNSVSTCPEVDTSTRHIHMYMHAYIRAYRQTNRLGRTVIPASACGFMVSVYVSKHVSIWMHTRRHILSSVLIYFLTQTDTKTQTFLAFVCALSYLSLSKAMECSVPFGSLLVTPCNRGLVKKWPVTRARGYITLQTWEAYRSRLHLLMRPKFWDSPSTCPSKVQGPPVAPPRV